MWVRYTGTLCYRSLEGKEGGGAWSGRGKGTCSSWDPLLSLNPTEQMDDEDEEHMDQAHTAHHATGSPSLVVVGNKRGVHIGYLVLCVSTWWLSFRPNIHHHLNGFLPRYP